MTLAIALNRGGWNASRKEEAKPDEKDRVSRSDVLEERRDASNKSDRAF